MKPNEQLTLSNEIAIDESGWALIAPYGEHRKSRTLFTDKGEVQQNFLQVIDNTAADMMLATENSLFRKMRRAFVGIPVFMGHPDLREYEPNDKAANVTGRVFSYCMGVVDKLRKSDRGIEARFLLSPRGAEYVTQHGAKYVSALWNVKNCDEQPDPNVLHVRPFKLLSVGLTANPNISGVDSLANARTNPTTENTTNQNQIMKDKLIGLLMGCGVVLANDVPDNQVIDQIMQLVTKNKNEAATLSNEKTTASARVSTLENEAVSLNAKLTAAQTALSNEQGRFSVERTGRASALVDLAITQGRLAPSDREARITALSNSAQFDADAAALASQAVTHKTEAGLVESSRKTLANGGDPVTAFKAAVADRVTKGDTKPKAIAFVIANNRDLHHAYIKAGGSSSI